MAEYRRAGNFARSLSFVPLNISRFRKPCQCEELCNLKAGQREVGACPLEISVGQNPLDRIVGLKLLKMLWIVASSGATLTAQGECV
jgi:hypothetical protein